MASPTAAQELKVQRTITDLDTFSDITVGKTSSFTPVATSHEALARLGNDESKLLKAINEGLRAEEMRQLGDTPGGWYIVDEDNKLTDKPFNGTQADRMKVNAFVLGMAKSVFSYNKDMSPAEKEQAKQSAIDTIKNTPVIFSGMKKNCAVTE